VIFRDMEAVTDKTGKPLVDPKTRAPKLRRIKVLARMMNPVKFERREVFSAMHSKWADEILTAMADKVMQTIMIFTIGAFGVGMAVIIVLFTRFGPMISEILKIVRSMVTPALLSLVM